MRILCLPVAFLAFALSAPAGADSVSAQESTGSVKELVKQGTAEYTKQNWEAARTVFLKAWDLKPHYAIAGSLADVEMKLGRYKDAAEHLKYAIANLPPEHAERRAEAEADLKECRAHLASLRVSLNVSGLLVLVKLDGVALTQRSLNDELLVDPGSHKLEATQEGYQSATREFVAVAGEAREIRLELAREPAPSNLDSAHAAHVAAATSSASTSDSGRDGYTPRTWALIGGGAATVVAAGLGTYFTLRYFSLKSDASQLLAQAEAEGSPALVAKHDECAPGAPMRPAACDQLAQTLDSRVTAANLSTASWIAAGVLGVATITTYFVWPAEQAGPVKQSRVVIVPWLVGARGGALQVDF